MRYLIRLGGAGTLAGLLLMASPAAAQTGTYYFSLAAETPPLPTAYPFYVAQVVDARLDRSSLGTVQHGWGNAAAPADFRAGLVGELTAFLSARLAARPDAPPLLLRVTGLRVGEFREANGERALAELRAEWYQLGPDGRYRLLHRTTQGAEESALVDGTKAHARNVAAALVQSVVEVAGAPAWRQPAATAAARPAFTLAELQRPEPPHPYPIQTAAAPQAGVYASFGEWRQNQPGEPGRPVVEARPYRTAEWAGYQQITPYWPTPEGRREPLPASAWGFSDGERVYVRFGRDYYLLEKRGPHYLFFVPAPPSYSPAGSLAGGVLGGAMGSLIMGSSSDGRKFPLALSIQSGQITPYDGAAYAAESALTPAAARPTTLLLLYNTKAKAKAESALRIAAPGQPPRTLRPHDFASFSWPAPPAEPLCAGGAEGAPACQALELAPGVANYYECLPGATPGSAPTLHRLDAPAGAALLRRLLR